MHVICPQSFAQALFSISLGAAVIPRRNERQRLYINFWGANKVNYGRCASGRELKLVEMKGGWQEFALLKPCAY